MAKNRDLSKLANRLTVDNNYNVGVSGSLSVTGSAQTISFRIGTTGGSGKQFEWNPYYGAGGFDSSTVGNFTYIITEIGQ